jgi:hypothetical protein
MLRYYLQILRDLPAVFRETLESWTFWAAIFLAVLGFFSPEVAAAVNKQAGSRWLALIPGAVFFLWAMLRANYKRFQGLQSGYSRLESMIPPGGIVQNPPKHMPPIGYYVYQLRKHEREDYERLKVEVAELRRRLGSEQG